MQQAPVITYRHLEVDPQVDADIRRRVERLERLFDKIIGCHVVVEAPHRHQGKGRVFKVDIDLALPGEDIHIGRKSEKDQAREELSVAIRDSFEALERRLKRWVARRRGRVKHHEGPPSGRVIKLFPEKGYGFIGQPDGGEVYFHRNAVLGAGFEALAIGSEVRYALEMGEQGQQASTVSFGG